VAKPLALTLRPLVPRGETLEASLERIAAEVEGLMPMHDTLAHAAEALVGPALLGGGLQDKLGEDSPKAATEVRTEPAPKAPRATISASGTSSPPPATAATPQEPVSGSRPTQELLVAMLHFAVMVDEVRDKAWRARREQVCDSCRMCDVLGHSSHILLVRCFD
jgi:hypothetical protein